jgi:hypothetical protein
MKIDAVSTMTGAPAQQAAPEFTDKEKRDELANEVNRRKRDYPSQVRQGRMTFEQSERSKAIMYAIWQDYVAKLTQPADHSVADDDNRQPLNAMAHAGDGDGAKREATHVFGVDHGAGDDMTTTHQVVAGGGDGEIGRPVRPVIEDVSTPPTESHSSDTPASSDAVSSSD